MSRIRVALVLLGDAMLCVALVLISQIDKLVNGTLYNFGLIFNDSWAQPYWLMLRTCMALIVAAVILISVVELPYPAFQDKAEEKKKEPELTANSEETESLTDEEEEPVSARLLSKKTEKQGQP